MLTHADTTILPGFDEVGALVARFNLRRVYYWLLLASLVGLVGGIGALVFKWLADHVLAAFWPTIVSFVPPSAGGEPVSIVAHGPIRAWGLIVAPAVGGLLSGLLVYRFAPEAAGHGTDAAIRAYHRDGGRIRWQTPLVKLVASALTLGSGGSAGREGPIAQIGAGFGSLLGTMLRLSDRERGVLLMAGVSAGIGAIFRAVEQDRAIVEDMASKFSCSNGVARDFAGQCEERLVDLDFDLLCSQLALDFCSSPPERARPVVDVLRELADERQRHRDALAKLRERLLDFTGSDAPHHHLDLPIEHYRQQVRQALFPDPVPPAGPELRGIR